jgi:hypothetical protein
MPAHEEAITRLRDKAANAKTREEQNHWLDLILDYTQNATEWDADQWGLDPDRWMEAERDEMEHTGTEGGGGGGGQ